MLKNSNYSEESFITKTMRFIYLKTRDIRNAIKNKKKFNEYGLSLFCGKQGAGKTIALTEQLEYMRKKYPKAIIVTNFGYKNETYAMKDWKDFFEIRNGEEGVIFAIDEIQNEFNSTDWKKFPETLLGEITQQRKQRIKILATSQVFSRVAKQLREQCYEVIECYTILGRWTVYTAYDGYEYGACCENPEKKSKLKHLWKRSFIQDDKIRNLYDSYAKIERIKRTEFLERDKRIQ